MVGFRSLKAELDEDLAGILQRVEQFKTKIKANLYSNENQDGLLTRGEEKYLSCLQIEYQRLENLYREDEAQWAENLETVKAQSERLKDELQEALRRQ